MKLISAFLMACIAFAASSVAHAADDKKARTKDAPSGQVAAGTTNPGDSAGRGETQSPPPRPPRPHTIDDLALYQLLSFSLLLLIFFPLIWLRTHKAAGGQGASISQAEVLALSNAVAAAVASRTSQLATTTSVMTSESNIKKALNDMGPKLVESVARAAAIEVNKTQLGELTAKFQALEAKLKQADLALADEKLRTSAAQKDCDAAVAGRQASEKSAADAAVDKATAEQRLSELRISLDATGGQLTSVRIEAEKARADLDAERRTVSLLRAEAGKGFDLLAPTRLMGTDLSPQMQAMHQESLDGNVSSAAAWSTLTAFASAQLDPTAKDFQLQIVRRLGFTLVSYWKQKGLSEKDCHDRLVHWAKALNEHADGRYNLLVPALGEPIDKARMACASSATAIREVLCWQVRNPAGANFSLAEVA
jgi:hypothetical protein